MQVFLEEGVDLSELAAIEDGLKGMVTTVGKVEEVNKDAEDHHFQVCDYFIIFGLLMQLN